MRKNYEDTRTPLNVVLARRREAYEALLEREVAKVYETGDLAIIDAFERNARALFERKSGNSRARPVLTFERYARARDKGKTSEWMQEHYRVDNVRAFCGYGRHYAAVKKAEK
jgi:hypothetical protein